MPCDSQGEMLKPGYGCVELQGPGCGLVYIPSGFVKQHWPDSTGPFEVDVVIWVEGTDQQVSVAALCNSEPGQTAATLTWLTSDTIFRAMPAADWEVLCCVRLAATNIVGLKVKGIPVLGQAERRQHVGHASIESQFRGQPTSHRTAQAAGQVTQEAVMSIQHPDIHHLRHCSACSSIASCLLALWPGGKAC